jgi:hypothetical protein
MYHVVFLHLQSKIHLFVRLEQRVVGGGWGTILTNSKVNKYQTLPLPTYRCIFKIWNSRWKFLRNSPRMLGIRVKEIFSVAIASNGSVFSYSMTARSAEVQRTFQTSSLSPWSTSSSVDPPSSWRIEYQGTSLPRGDSYVTFSETLLVQTPGNCNAKWTRNRLCSLKKNPGTTTPWTEEAPRCGIPLIPLDNMFHISIHSTSKTAFKDVTRSIKTAFQASCGQWSQHRDQTSIHISIHSIHVQGCHNVNQDHPESCCHSPRFQQRQHPDEHEHRQTFSFSIGVKAPPIAKDDETFHDVES